MAMPPYAPRHSSWAFEVVPSSVIPLTPAPHHRPSASESLIQLDRSASYSSSLTRSSSRKSWASGTLAPSDSSHTNLLANTHAVYNDRPSPSGSREHIVSYKCADYLEKALPPLPLSPRRPAIEQITDRPITLSVKFWTWYNCYRQLHFLIILLNLTGVILAATKTWELPRRKPTAFVVGNVFISVVFRSEWILRGIYWLVVKGFRIWPPLTVRVLIVSFMYHIGGLHSGCGLASLMWLTWATYNNYTHSRWYNVPILLTMAICLVCIAITCITAIPIVRGPHHNLFELNHRFTGWLGIVATWAFVLSSAFWNVHTRTWEIGMSRVVWRQEFWFTVGLTIIVAAAWISVAEVPVSVTAPSRKVSIIKFPGGLTSGVHTRVSRGGLREWHVFGSISEGRHADCHYVVMAVQGEFTAGINRETPSTLFTRRWKLCGLPYFSRLFRKGVAICTGSGIGAVGSTCLQHSNWYLVWIGGDLEETYGFELYRLIMKGTEGRSNIWDTKQKGRPNINQVLEDTFRMWGADVALFIGSPAMNKDVLRTCRAKGIPAFGSIWDA